MAPTTRTQTAPRKAAQTSKRSRRKSGTAPADPELTCTDCGKQCKSAAGLASHRRTQHPDDAPAAAPAEPAAAAERAVPVAPEGIGGPALELWRQIVNVYDLRPDEVRILQDACGEVMIIDKLKRELDDGAPLIVKGSMGQQVASPLLTEIRQHRGTLSQLLARLRLPDDPGEVSSDSPGERAVKARAAANARWRRGV